MSRVAMILVADDDPGVRETVVDILSRMGHHVIEAEDGEAALVRLANDQVDVAVLDVRMPKRDGISVVENLVPEPPPPVILIVSAYDVDNEVHERLGRRVFKYLQKPVSPVELIEAVAEAVERAGPART
jgi:CheY-like chemotaxis protein